MTAPLVQVRDLTVRFASHGSTTNAVNGVDLDLWPREVLCILGESGSGKTALLRALMRLNPPKRTLISGRIDIAGHDIVAASPRELKAIRGKLVAMVFQEPLTAFDPVFTIGQQIVETIKGHDGLGQADATRRAVELLDLVQIPSARRRLAAYPHELSGGLRQRAMIALALSCRPRLLLADEPTTALDATVQIQILMLLRRLQQEFDMAVILVTHDLGVAGEIADRVAVMYAGRFVEEAPIGDFVAQPRHPYSQGLLAATLCLGQDGGIATIPGEPPDPRRLPAGCAFAPRCRLQAPACLAAMPPLEIIAADRRARCIRVAETAS